MTKDIGRVGDADQALVASDQAASRLAPAGFDPSRYSALLSKSSILQHQIKQLKELVLHAYWEGWDDGWSSGTAMPQPIEVTGEEVERQWHLSNVRRAYDAIAMEARQGGNEVPSRSDDSAGPKDIAQ